MERTPAVATPAVAAPINRAMDATEWGLLLGMSVLWGSSFFFAGVALAALPPLTIVVLRVGLAALMLAAVMPLLGLALPREGAVWRAFFGMGLLNNVVPFCLIVWSQTHIASGLAAILGATTPFATVIVLVDMPLWIHFQLAAERQIAWATGRLEHPPAGIASMPPTAGLFETIWTVDRDWMPEIRRLVDAAATRGVRVTRIPTLEQLDAEAR